MANTKHFDGEVDSAWKEGLWLLWVPLLFFVESHALPTQFDEMKECFLAMGFVAAAVATKFHFPKWSTRAFVCFAVFLGIGIAAAMRPSAWFADGAYSVARYLVWFLGSVSLLALPAPLLRRLLLSVGICSFLIVAILVLGERGYDFWSRNENFVAPFGHISYFADAMAFAALVSGIALLRVRELPLRFGAAMVFVASWGALWNSATRSSCLAYLSAWIPVVWILRFHRPRWNFALLIALHFVTVGAGQFLFVSGLRSEPMVQRLIAPSKAAAFLSLSGKDSAKTWASWNDRLGARVSIWRNSVRMIAERPWFGFGAGRYRFEYPAFAYKTEAALDHVNMNKWLMHPHIELLFQLGEVGFVGLVFLLLGAFLFFWDGAKNAERDSIRRGWFAIGAAGLVFFLLVWQLNTSSQFAVNRFLFSLSIAAFFVGCRTKSTTSVHRVGRAGCSMLLVLAASFVCVAVYAEYCVERARNSSETDDSHRWQHRASQIPLRGFNARLLEADLANRGASNDPEAVGRLFALYPSVPIVQLQEAIARIHSDSLAGVEQLLRYAAFFEDPPALANGMLRRYHDAEDSFSSK